MPGDNTMRTYGDQSRKDSFRKKESGKKKLNNIKVKNKNDIIRNKNISNNPFE